MANVLVGLVWVVVRMFGEIVWEGAWINLRRLVTANVLLKLQRVSL